MLLDLLTKLRAVRDIFHIMKLYYVAPIAKSEGFISLMLSGKGPYNESVLRGSGQMYV